jgi:hypothetical protein
LLAAGAGTFGSGAVRSVTAVKHPYYTALTQLIKGACFWFYFKLQTAEHLGSAWFAHKLGFCFHVGDCKEGRYTALSLPICYNDLPDEYTTNQAAG